MVSISTSDDFLKDDVQRLIQHAPRDLESLLTSFNQLRDWIDYFMDKPFYGNSDLYNAFIEAKQYLDSKPTPYDLVVGTKNGQTQVHCLYYADPGFRPTNPLINFEFPPFNDPEIKPTKTDPSVNQLFEMNEMISWVAFGIYNDQEGYLVATLAPYITPIGQQRVPDFWKGYPVWQFAMAYRPLGGAPMNAMRQDPVMMGDTIGPKDLLKSYGTLGLFLTDASERIYLMSNYHVLQVDELTKERKILQPNYKSVQVSYNQPTNLGEYTLAIFIPNLSYRGSIEFEGYPFGIDLGIAEVRKRRIIPQPRDSIYESHEVVMNCESRSPCQGEYVYKCGAATALTEGMVTIMNLPVRNIPQYRFYSTLTKENLNKTTKTTVFYNQVMFMSLMASADPFCDFGDSGSIAINRNGNPIALLHGATRNLQYSFGTDLTIVFRFLRQRMDQPMILC